jgi:5-methylcytosine-specific restriction enzyme A
MKIEQQHWTSAYELGRKIHQGEMSLTEGSDALAKLGVNPNSAISLLNNLRNMLEGTRYTRAMSTATTDDFLTWIQRDYGTDFYANAIAAVRQHIIYYTAFGRAQLGSHREILAKHEGLLPVEFQIFESPEEIPASVGHTEGKVRLILVNIYERNREARTKCIAHYGPICCVCKFDFSKTYGKIGEGFIHVHHLKEVSSIGKEYKINPVEDLRPVCPNCHAMIHTSRPSLTIEALRKCLSTAN